MIYGNIVVIPKDFTVLAHGTNDVVYDTLYNNIPTENDGVVVKDSKDNELH